MIFERRLVEGPHPGVSHIYTVLYLSTHYTWIGDTLHTNVSLIYPMCRLLTQCVAVPIWGVWCCWYALHFIGHTFSDWHRCYSSRLRACHKFAFCMRQVWIGNELWDSSDLRSNRASLWLDSLIRTVSTFPILSRRPLRWPGFRWTVPMYQRRFKGIAKRRSHP